MPALNLADVKIILRLYEQCGHVPGRDLEGQDELQRLSLTRRPPVEADPRDEFDWLGRLSLCVKADDFGAAVWDGVELSRGTSEDPRQHTYLGQHLDVVLRAAPVLHRLNYLW